jgi:plastocyanin
MNRLALTARFTLALMLSAAASMAGAASLAVTVQDSAGHPVTDAAVYAEAASGQVLPKSLKPVEIEQRHRQFLPLVTVVEVGTEIAFPNHDTVRHHVYSFSPAKAFEIKLYSGTGKSELFDKPGTVVVGCNIHDQMVAYIHVVPTPYFAKTDASGKAVLTGLVPGKYQLKAWHYNLPPGAQVVEQPISYAGSDMAAAFTLNLKAAPATN